MGILEMLLGAGPPKPTQKRDAPTFVDINVESDHSKESIRLARQDCLGNEWSQLEQQLRRLPVANASKAETLLRELHKGEHYAQASNVDAAMCYAAQRTSYDAGNFAELANRAEAKSEPIPYLMALHSWKGVGDSFGTKASYFVRIADNSWLCAGQTRFGS